MNLVEPGTEKLGKLGETDFSTGLETVRRIKNRKVGSTELGQTWSNQVKLGQTWTGFDTVQQDLTWLKWV